MGYSGCHSTSLLQIARPLNLFCASRRVVDAQILDIIDLMVLPEWLTADSPSGSLTRTPKQSTAQREEERHTSPLIRAFRHVLNSSDLKHKQFPTIDSQECLDDGNKSTDGRKKTLVHSPGVRAGPRTIQEHEREKRVPAVGCEVALPPSKVIPGAPCTPGRKRLATFHQQSRSSSSSGSFSSSNSSKQQWHCGVPSLVKTPAPFKKESFTRNLRQQRGSLRRLSIERRRNSIRNFLTPAHSSSRRRNQDEPMVPLITLHIQFAVFAALLLFKDAIPDIAGVAFRFMKFCLMQSTLQLKSIIITVLTEGTRDFLL